MRNILRTRESFAYILFLAVAVISLLHLLSVWFGWYYIYTWIDNPLHVMGGAFVALLFLNLFLVRKPQITFHHPLALFVLGLSFVAFIGIVWELYEFFSDIFILHAYPPFSAPPDLHFDTLKDLVNDLLGGATTLLLYLWRAKKS